MSYGLNILAFFCIYLLVTTEYNFFQATRRAASAGLGARGANLVAEEGATYKECVKKTMFARFHDIE